METSTPTTVCRTCGTALASPAEGIGPLCPGCLLDFALDESIAENRSRKDASTPPLSHVASPLDERFAHYVLSRRGDGTLAELGRGSMGVTYRATDTALHREVALKVVNPDLVQDPQVRARFAREARAAAGLRHPHVASVFLFGERVEDGQLFYAMELVEGETLAARVRRCGGLPVKTVLEIGRQVADALAAAEARGLTHRDLKPANLMLVEGEAINVKVIDFGLAKAAAESAEAAGLTDTQGFVGTPAFASPEQGNVWQETDARSDFYALGATLWFALTGQPPFAGRTPAEIRDQQLRAPLRLAPLRAARTPHHVGGLLRSLLSADPAGRPQTADELAAAFERCRQTPSRRRRWTVGLAVAGAVLALALGLRTVARHATGDLARQNARLQLQTSAQQQQLDALQIQLQQQSQLIAQVSARLDRNASGLAIATVQTEIARERGIDVGTLQKQLADEGTDVRALLVRIDQGLAAARAGAGQWQELKRTALTRLAEGEFAAGRYAAASEPYRQALALIDADAQGLVWCDIAERLAIALRQSGRYAEAAPLMQTAVDRRTARQGPEAPDTLKVMSSRAALLDDQGDLAGSEALYRKALEAQERTLGKEHRDTLRTLNGLSVPVAEAGHLAEAEALGRRVLEASERTLGLEDPFTLGCVNNLAATFYDEGRYADGAALNRRCLEARERLLGPDHPLAFMVGNNLGNDLHKQGDTAGAEALYRRTLATAERVLGPDHPSTLRVVNNLAILLREKGDVAGGIALFRRAVAGHERAEGPDHRETLESIGNLADALNGAGELSEAEALYRRALAGEERTLGPDHPLALSSASNLGSLLQARGDYAAAEPLLRRALAGQERALGYDHPDTLSSLSNLAQFFDAKGDLAAAEPIYQEAQAKMERSLPPTDNYRLDQEHHFSLFREKQGRLTEALALAVQAAEGCQNMTAESSLRRTYEQHLQTLQAKMAAAAPSPSPTPARITTAR